MWGYSAALDLLQERRCLFGSQQQRETIRDQFNVLLVGACDGRHVIKTLSRKQYCEEETAINFYVIEQSLEPVARQILLLTLALEPPSVLGLQEKAVLFLDIFGNTIIRPTSYNYVIQKSHQLIHMVTDLEFLAKRMPIINIDNLKYKERDALETIFKFWLNTKPKHLDIEILWDNRLRRFLADRYDSKMGVFDWDYHMKLCEVGQESISLAEYKKWRLKGIAYSWLDRVLSKPNNTLVSGIQKVNGDVISFGYTGDIENGPFAAYGLQNKSDDSKHRRQNPRFCTGTSLKNVMEIMNGIVRTTESVDVPNESDLAGTFLVDDMQENLCSMTDKSEDANNIGTNKNLTKKECYTSVPIDSVKVTFLPCAFLTEIQRKDKFKSKFDVIVIAHNSINNFNANLMEAAKPHALILVETLKFALPPKNGTHELFDAKVDSLAKECNCKPVQMIGGKDDFFIRFELVKV